MDEMQYYAMRVWLGDELFVAWFMRAFVTEKENKAVGSLTGVGTSRK